MSETELTKVLSPPMLWGLGEGYVISGMYFGWNFKRKLHVPQSLRLGHRTAAHHLFH